MSTHPYTLGGVPHQAEALPLGKLRVVLPALQRVLRDFAVGAVTESSMDDVARVLAAATSHTEAELAAMPIHVHEIPVAIEAIARASGLEFQSGEGAAGEACAAVESTGTTSTAA